MNPPHVIDVGTLQVAITTETEVNIPAAELFTNELVTLMKKHLLGGKVQTNYGKVVFIEVSVGPAKSAGPIGPEIAGQKAYGKELPEGHKSLSSGREIITGRQQ